MVGEIRDQETAEIAVHAALMGYLVFITLDTNEAAGAVARLVDSAVKNLIREGKTHQLESVMQTGKEDGVHTMDYSLRELYLEGKISRQKAMEKAGDEKILENLL